MRGSLTVLAFVGVSGFASLINMGVAQDADGTLMREVKELKRGQDQVRKELVEVKALLTKITSPTMPQINVKDVEIDLGDNAVLGDDGAKLVLVEISDYECPFCGRYVRETFPRLFEEYVSKGIIRYAVFSMPLPRHTLAGKAAEAAHCANEQGKYWDMHKLMMSRQDSLGDLPGLARDLKVDADAFEKCLKTNRYKGQIDKETALARKLGITGVPGFVLASSDPRNPRVVKGISAMIGAQPFDSFKKEIDRALASIE